MLNHIAPLKINYSYLVPVDLTHNWQCRLDALHDPLIGISWLRIAMSLQILLSLLNGSETEGNRLEYSLGTIEFHGLQGIWLNFSATREPLNSFDPAKRQVAIRHMFPDVPNLVSKRNEVNQLKDTTDADNGSSLRIRHPAHLPDCSERR